MLSHLLGLEKDTFLSTLRENFITVQNAWELSSQDKALLKMVEEQECNLMPKPGETMIPMEAAAPLMKAYLFMQSTTLDNEKHILRYLKNFQWEIGTQLEQSRVIRELISMLLIVQFERE